MSAIARLVVATILLLFLAFLYWFLMVRPDPVPMWGKVGGIIGFFLAIFGIMVVTGPPKRAS